jgi:hypothetical protein
VSVRAFPETINQGGKTFPELSGTIPYAGSPDEIKRGRRESPKAQDFSLSASWIP